MIEIQNLEKKYGDELALNNINLEISDSEIFGLLGPNGSGKSTLMKIISGIIEPTSGFISVDGIDPVENPNDVKEFIGYVPESANLYDSMTPQEYFEYVGSIRKVSNNSFKRIEKFIEAFEIEDKINNDIGSLSFGMKQKVSIIAALIHNPKILILDESMNGLDPKSVKVLKKFLNSYSNSDKTIIYSTHVLEVAEKICDRVAIMKDGEIASTGSVEELRDLLKSPSLEDIFFELTQEEDFEPIIRALQDTM